jgi:hypothetical protein
MEEIRKEIPKTSNNTYMWLINLLIRESDRAKRSICMEVYIEVYVRK